MILVIGSTGKIGRRLVARLAAGGANVRAMAREPKRAEALVGPGVEIVRADLGDPETLEAAFRGVEKAFLVSALDPRQIELQGNAVDAARHAGVRHLVKISVGGADVDSTVPIMRWHAQTERQLEVSGVPFTLLRPNYFMQNLLAFGPAVRSDGVIHAPMKDGRISMVDLRDVVEVADVVLTEPGHEGSVYTLTGPEALSFTDVAGGISAVTGRKVIYMDVPPDEARRSMVESGTPEWAADVLVKLYRMCSDDGASALTGDVERLIGRRPRSLEEFVAEHAAEFTPRERAAA